VPLFRMVHGQLRHNVLLVTHGQFSQSCRLSVVRRIKRGTHPIRFSNSWVSCAVKLVPKSDEIYDQQPTNCHGITNILSRQRSHRITYRKTAKTINSNECVIVFDLLTFSSKEGSSTINEPMVKYTICPRYRFDGYSVTVGNPGLQLAGFTCFYVLLTIFTETWPIESVTNASLGALKSNVPTKRVLSHFQNMGLAALRHSKLINILAQNLCTVVQQIIFYDKPSTSLIS